MMISYSLNTDGIGAKCVRILVVRNASNGFHAMAATKHDIKKVFGDNHTPHLM